MINQIRVLDDQYRTKSLKLIFLLLGALCLVSLLSVVIGPYALSLNELIQVFSSPFKEHSINHSIVFGLRAPRLFLGVFAGGALALGGGAMQSLFRNPLAEPGLIGISSGALIMVLMGIVLQSKLSFFALIPTSLFYPILGFLGSLLMSYLVYAISHQKGMISVPMMLLAGIAANALAGAFAGLILFISTDEQLRTITFWTMGSLAAGKWSLLLPLTLFVLGGLFVIIRQAHDLEILKLGEKEALHLGVPIEKVKAKLFFATALMVGAVVSVTGIIGFVGLVVPHLIRSRVSLPLNYFFIVCFIVGGVFLAFADIIVKMILPPSELSIGIVTSFIGTPYLIYLLVTQTRGESA